MTSMLTPQRVETEELLDQESAPYDEMIRSLHDLRRINRWLGGFPAYRRIVRLLAGTRPVRILDLGTGTSDLFASLSPEKRPNPVGLDFRIEHLVVGRTLDGGAAGRVTGDAFRLPFGNGTFDLVTSSHFFHHFSPDENVEILTEALRVSRLGVAVTDTRRNYVPLTFVRLLCALRIFGPITRFDAPASVLQGYTLDEVRSIGARVATTRCQTIRIFPWRFGLLLWK